MCSFLTSENIAAIIGAIATLFAAAVAVFGVWISLRSNRRENELNRLQHLKRETYVGAIEGMMPALQILGLLCDPSFPNSAANEPIGKFAAAIGELHVLGDNLLIQTADRFYAAFLRCFQDLLVERTRLSSEEANQLKAMRKTLEIVWRDRNELRDLQIQIIILMRKELRLKFDEELYIANAKKQSDAIVQSAKEAIERLGESKDS